MLKNNDRLRYNTRHKLSKATDKEQRYRVAYTEQYVDNKDQLYKIRVKYIFSY